MPVLKKCTLSDATQLLELARRTFIEAFEKDNNPDDFSQYLETTYTLPGIKAQLSNPDCSFYFVFIDSDLVGYFKLNKGPAQTDLRDDTALELERIYVDGTFQSQGIGKWMVQQAIDIAQTAKMASIWLGVWQRNTNAI